jgi:hypothetical protein
MTEDPFIRLFYVKIKNFFKFSISVIFFIVLNLYKCGFYVQAWKNSEMVTATRKCGVSHVSAMQTHNARNRILFYEEIRTCKSCLMQIKPYVFTAERNF